MSNLAALVLGYILDLIFGDLKLIRHPVIIMGDYIKDFEENIRPLFGNSEKAEFIAGIILNISLLGLSFIIPFGILYWANGINPMFSFFLQVFFSFRILATNSLRAHSMRVYFPLKKNHINRARRFLSYIVGRETKKLEPEEIIKATVETVSENTCDGIVAPMFYMIIGGIPLGFLYKAANTLDSMVGYKNDKYKNFGKFSAKVDDVLNFIPAIISAYCMIFSAFILRLPYKNAYKIYKRDHKNTESPNAGRTESAMAGILGIALGGDSVYNGVLVKKKTLGDNERKPKINDILVANRVILLTSIVSMVFLIVLKIIIVRLV